MRSLNDAPPQSIILLEDVDGIFNQREAVIDVDEEGNGGVSFSGLLNALDGVRSQEGRILFMTTNHPERLDPALVRPGRCDIQIELKNATSSMVERLFLKFFPGEEKKATEFSRLIPESKISMAKLQGHFLKYRNNVDTVLDHYKETLTEEQQLSEMTVVEWLDRQNLQRYVPQFVRQTCFFVSEIKYHVDTATNTFSDKFKFYADRDKTRLTSMVMGQADAVADFQYLTRHRALSILSQDIQDADICEQIADLLPQSDGTQVKTLTGHQLRDIIAESYSLDDLMEGIKARVKVNNDKDVYKRDPRIIADKALEEHDDLEEETEEEKNARWGDPKVTLSDILKEFDLVEETKDKLKEIDYSDDILWYVDADELVGLLEIKDFSKSKKLPKRIK